MSEDVVRQLRKRFKREHAARIEAEKLLEDKADELYSSLIRVQSSEALLQSALSSMSDGLLLIDEEQKVVLINDELKVLYADIADIFFRGAYLSGRFDALLDHPEYTQLIKAGSGQTQFEIDLPGNRVVSVAMRLSSEGFVASTHREITSLKLAEMERRRLLVELMRSQRMQAIGKMAGMIAHDFNNIVASIKGYAGFLYEDLAADPGAKESADRILTAAGKAEDLIHQILEYGNQQQAPRHRISLVPVLEDCVDLISPTIDSSIELSLEAPDEPIWVEANETRLNRLFVNLLTNARQAMEGRSGTLRIVVDRFDRFDSDQWAKHATHLDPKKIEFSRSGIESFDVPGVSISIIDNGTGIKPDDMVRIFEMYFSTKKKGGHRGVGMASVADVVGDYGGGMQLTSQSLVGTVAQVVFPQAIPVDRQSIVDTPVNVSSSSKRDVLIIDDDESVGLMACEMLERAGISAEFKNDATESLEQLLEQPDRWKMVVSDQIMPNFKGSEILERLRDANIDIPFVICSGRVDTGSQTTIALLKDPILQKPIDREAFLATVRQYV